MWDGFVVWGGMGFFFLFPFSLGAAPNFFSSLPTHEFFSAGFRPLITLALVSVGVRTYTLFSFFFSLQRTTKRLEWGRTKRPIVTEENFWL